MPKLLSRSKHEEFKSNSALQIRYQKERRAENARKVELQEILHVEKLFMRALFTCLTLFIKQPLFILPFPFCCLFCFLFFFFFLPILSIVIAFGFDFFFCNFPCSEHYISSVKLSQAPVKSTFNQSIKLTGEAFSSPAFLTFSPFSLIFFHFLAIQTRLDDDKSRHAWLNCKTREISISGKWAK